MWVGRAIAILILPIGAECELYLFPVLWQNPNRKSVYKCATWPNFVVLAYYMILILIGDSKLSLSNPHLNCVFMPLIINYSQNIWYSMKHNMSLEWKEHPKQDISWKPKCNIVSYSIKVFSMPIYCCLDYMSLTHWCICKLSKFFS